MASSSCNLWTFPTDCGESEPHQTWLRLQIKYCVEIVLLNVLAGCGKKKWHAIDTVFKTPTYIIKTIVDSSYGRIGRNLPILCSDLMLLAVHLSDQAKVMCCFVVCKKMIQVEGISRLLACLSRHLLGTCYIGEGFCWQNKAEKH